MIVSTSSFNVHLSEGNHDFVEECLRDAFGYCADDVISADARLEVAEGLRGRMEYKVVIQVELRGFRVVSEFQDINLYAAVRHAVVEAAFSAERHLQDRHGLTTHTIPVEHRSISRYPAAQL